MTTPYFTDPKQPPTEAAILAVVGVAANAWGQLFGRIRAQHPDLVETWGYYTDGKSWLLKVARRAKTVFWLSVEEGGFRVAFYFPERLVDALLASELSAARKAEIRATSPTGKLRRVAVTFGQEGGGRDEPRMQDVMALVGLKKSLK